MNVATAVDSTHVELIPEDDGTFSVIVPDLPGVESCGDTEAEAIENVKEALAGVMAEYHDSGDEVPWLAFEDAVRTPGRRTLCDIGIVGY